MKSREGKPDVEARVSSAPKRAGSSKRLRSWVTPITIGSFLLIGVTGVLMFFKWGGGLVVIVHEWLSPLFVIGACVHTWLNWSAVRKHLSQRRGLVVVGAFVALLLLSLAPIDEVSEIAREHGHAQDGVDRKAAELLLGARVSTLAELTGRTPQQLKASLGRHGVRITSDDLVLADAVRQSQVHPAHVLAVLLDDEHEHARGRENSHEHE